MGCQSGRLVSNSASSCIPVDEVSYIPETSQSNILYTSHMQQPGPVMINTDADDNGSIGTLFLGPDLPSLTE